MIIQILKSEIFNEVEKRSSFEGSMIPERYDNVWANSEKGAILDSYWIEGYTAAIQLLKRYLTGNTVDYDLSTYESDEVITINSTMPNRYNSLLDGSVSTDIKMVIACNVLHGWMEVSNPEAAPKYEEETKAYAEDLRVKLLYRVEPENTFSSQKNDNVTISGSSSGLGTPKTDTETLAQMWGGCAIGEECVCR